MKNFIKKSIPFFLSFLFVLNSFSQETLKQYELRKYEMEKTEKKLKDYVSYHLKDEIPKRELDKFYISLKNHQHSVDCKNHVVTKKEENKRLHTFKVKYHSKQFFNKNPLAKYYFAPKSASPVCSNGGFETNSWLDYSGGFAYGSMDGYEMGDCTIESSDFNFTIPPNLSTSDSADFKIMTSGVDPFVLDNSLQTVFSGSHSARLNSSLDDPNGTSPNRGVNRLSKKILLTEDYQDIFFRYALVLTDPTSGHEGEKPTFKASLFKNDSIECDEICTEANVLDTFLRMSGSTAGTYPIIYQKWECGKLTACGLAGDSVTLEFLMTDCGAGAHWGYAYIDDICDTCISDSFNTQGSINLLPTDTCAGDTMDVCGTFNLAVFDSVVSTLDSIRLYVYQNGVAVAGPFVVTNIWQDSFCIKIDPSHFPSGATGGFDFYVEADFKFSSTSITTVNEVNTNPGPDNDYVFDPQCCPDFNVYTCCDIYGGIAPKSNRTFKNPVITPLIRSKISEYNKAVKKKYPVKSLTVDSCCMYCEFPDIPFPIFVFDEDGNPVDTYLYNLTYSHHPPPYYAQDSLLPDSTTIITITGPGSCFWTDTFSYECCDNLSSLGVCCDTFDLNLDIDSICVGDPCDLGLLNYPLNVNINGTLLGYSGYYFTWSNGSHANIIGVSRGTQDVWVAVYDSSAGCTDTAFYSVDCEPSCTPTTPTNAVCRFINKTQTLTWDAIPGMTYEVELNFNDPFCCKKSGKTYREVHPVTTNAFYGSYWASCFSWRVRSVCPDGTKSQWTTKICSCDKPIVIKCFPKEPENLRCQRVGLSQSLSWNSVPNVSLYEIEFIYGAGKCCNSLQQVQEFVTTTNNFYSGPFFRRCFSWRVRSICPDGSRGDWSDRKCSCIKPIVIPNNGTATKIMKQDDDTKIEVETIPNPAIDIVRFDVVTTNTTKDLGDLIITNLMGEILMVSQVKLNGSTKVDLSKINSGTYIYKVVSDKDFKSGRIIKTK